MATPEDIYKFSESYDPGIIFYLHKGMQPYQRLIVVSVLEADELEMILNIHSSDAEIQHRSNKISIYLSDIHAIR